MLNIYRILSFVPPILLFFIPAFSQVQGKIEQIPGSNTYKVSVIPGMNWSPPQSVTSSAQITLRATSGKLSIASFQSLTGNWSAAQPISSPSEAPGYDYFSFSLSAPISNMSYVTGTPVPLFSFQNAGGCSQIEIVDNQTDPFLPPNSQSVNIGNSFSIFGAGIGQNAYQGNSPLDFVDCAPLDIYVVATDNPVKCNGDKTSIVVQLFGGAEPYNVSWENTASGNQGSQQVLDFEGTAVFDNMNPGSYIFTLKDNLDSTKHDTLVVQEPEPLTIELGAYDASCNGSLDGVAFVDDVDGGTAASDYQYFWANNPSVSSPTMGFLDPGTYTVTVEDDNGCAASGSVEVGAFAVIYPNPYIRDIKCHGDKNGLIDLYPVGANPPFTYEWSSNVSTSLNSSAWELGPGYYSVTLTDATGVCFEIAEFIIEEPPAIETDFALLEPVCYGDKGYLNILAVTNAFEPWTATVIGGEDVGTGQEFEVEPGLPGRLKIQDAKGCEISEDFLIPAKQEMYLDLGESFTIKYGEEVKIDPDIFPLNNVSLQWSPSEGLSCDNCPRPVAKPLESTTYRLQMVDSSGCVLEDNLTIGVQISRDIYIPTAFSPNQDGINDIFVPFTGFEVTGIQSFQVFDRWGGLIYTSEKNLLPGDPGLGWDGTAKGKALSSGTYLYSMNVEFIDGEVVLFSGEVNLLR
jgi:gliding motility-associated-like protein